DGVFEVIHVAVGRGAAAQHLSEAQARAYADKIFSDVLGFGGKDVFREPLLQIQVVCQPAKQSHRHMRVTIDEARDDYLAVGVHYFARSIGSIDFGGAADGNDAAALAGNRAVFDHLARLVHSYHGSASDD